MSETPERIWASGFERPIGNRYWHDNDTMHGACVEYVRADLFDESVMAMHESSSKAVIDRQKRRIEELEREVERVGDEAEKWCSLAMKLERERDEARRIANDWRLGLVESHVFPWEEQP